MKNTPLTLEKFSGIVAARSIIPMESEMAKGLKDDLVYEKIFHDVFKKWVEIIQPKLNIGNLHTLGNMVGDKDFVRRVLNGETRNPGIVRLMELNVAVINESKNKNVKVPDMFDMIKEYYNLWYCEIK